MYLANHVHGTKSFMVATHVSSLFCHIYSHMDIYVHIANYFIFQVGVANAWWQMHIYASRLTVVSREAKKNQDSQ